MRCNTFSPHTALYFVPKYYLNIIICLGRLNRGICSPNDKFKNKSMLSISAARRLSSGVEFHGISDVGQVVGYSFAVACQAEVQRSDFGRADSFVQSFYVVFAH